MTLRPSLVSVRGPGQSPGLPFAECVASSLSARPWGRCVLLRVCVCVGSAAAVAGAAGVALCCFPEARDRHAFSPTRSVPGHRCVLGHGVGAFCAVCVRVGPNRWSAGADSNSIWTRRWLTSVHIAQHHPCGRTPWGLDRPPAPTGRAAGAERGRLCAAPVVRVTSPGPTSSPPRPSHFVSRAHVLNTHFKDTWCICRGAGGPVPECGYFFVCVLGIRETVREA